MTLQNVNLNAEMVFQVFNISQERCNEIQKKVSEIQLKSYVDNSEKLENFVKLHDKSKDEYYPEFLRITNQAMADCLAVAETREEELLIMHHYQETDMQALEQWQRQRISKRLHKIVSALFSEG